MPENKNHNQLIYMKFNTHHQPHHGEIPHAHPLARATFRTPIRQSQRQYSRTYPAQESC
ncbi:hypothetical protein LHK_01181 [Laribacter hongkongensis HLHK9]|uniref:Uncharacterized protein n=1 Tax=Laribacter hongkongensis (strain HLHK9) TaxID=557598 RepID=C1D6R5_LARHH|nr:hypothetical protein LHK_01181 [Laribacter hongkongensis HLHK9]